MGLGITVRERRSFKIGSAEVIVISARTGECRMNINAPDDIAILRETERNLILTTLKLLRERSPEETYRWGSRKNVHSKTEEGYKCYAFCSGEEELGGDC